MFGSYDEAIRLLTQLKNRLASFDSPYFDYKEQIAGIDRAINVIQAAWDKEEEQFSAYYMKLNQEELSI